MSVAAKITERMRIGLAVSILPFDNPVRVAEDFAMIDVISNGRLDLGVGRGSSPAIQDAGPGGRAAAQPGDLRGVTRRPGRPVGNETFSYQGKHYQLDEVSITPRLFRSPVPRSMSPPSARRRSSSSASTT